MKQIVFLALLCLTFSAFSQQIDTTHAWQRVPGYYYEGNNWWDYYCFQVPSIRENYDYNLFARTPWGGYLTENARYFYTDNELKVIGISAAITYSLFSNTLDTALSHRPTDYYRLYIPDGNSMNMMREAAYDTSKVHRRIAVDYWRYYDNNYNTYYDEELREVYEAYFDKPIIVKDSFYISCTQYGNQDTTIVDSVIMHDGSPDGILIPQYHYYRKYLVNCLWRTRLYADSTFQSLPGYYKTRKLGSNPNMPDGEWQYIPDISFINIFPIIDTNYSFSENCVAPTELKARQLGANSVMIEWSDNAESFELHLKNEETLDTIISCNIGSRLISSLDTGLYTARIRSVCADENRTDWSEAIEFRIEGGYGQSDMLNSNTVLDQFTYLMPNPASSRVTVASSFRINKVAIYDASGNMVLFSEPKEMSASFDISMLPKGVYVVSISTNKGVAHKRLIVK